MKTYLFCPKFPDDKDIAVQIHQEYNKLQFGLKDVRLIFLHKTATNLSNYVPLIFYRAEHIFADEIDIDELMSQIDCYIAGKNPDELIFLKSAYEHGVEIRSFSAENISVFRDFPVDPTVEKYKADIRKIIQNQLFSKVPPDEFEYILCENGFGETLNFFYLMKEYKETYHKKICLVMSSLSRIHLMSKCPYVDIVITLTANAWFYLTIYYNFKNLWNLYRSPSLIDKNADLPDNDWTQNLRVREFLNLPVQPKLDRFTVPIPQESLEKAQTIFKQLNLKLGKTIYLVPYGLTDGNFENHRELIAELVKKLQNAGYDFIQNGSEKFIPDVTNVYLFFWETVALVQLCGNIIGVPTGWVEAISSLSTQPIKVELIMPDKKETLSTSFLKDLQMYGKNLWKNRVDTKAKFFSHFVGNNIRFNVHRIDDTDLINTVFNNIEGI